MKINLGELLSIAQKAARLAGEEILKIYESGDFSIEAKADDSPLTLADKASHEVIVSFLEQTEIPILSEEGREVPYSERSNWEYFWMIDPLDGTKEFIKKNGEFTVNIALIHRGSPILGVVSVPIQGTLYCAIQGQGSFKDGRSIAVSNRSQTGSGLRIVASRSHLSPETQAFIDQFNSPEIVSKGSSLKLLMIAEGAADLYPRYAPTMEWDTAAAHIIVEEAGGQVLQKESKESVIYNKEKLLNPWFLVVGGL
jgi:3'(2'), 5'-bisphosphate nucleotidase